jgi:hypothetical protein
MQELPNVSPTLSLQGRTDLNLISCRNDGDFVVVGDRRPSSDNRTRTLVPVAMAEPWLSTAGPPLVHSMSISSSTITGASYASYFHRSFYD